MIVNIKKKNSVYYRIFFCLLQRFKRVVYFSLCKLKLRCTHCWISTEIHEDMQLQTIVVHRSRNSRSIWNKPIDDSSGRAQSLSLTHTQAHSFFSLSLPLTTRTIYKISDYHYIIFSEATLFLLSRTRLSHSPFSFISLICPMSLLVSLIKKIEWKSGVKDDVFKQLSFHGKQRLSICFKQIHMKIVVWIILKLR